MSQDTKPLIAARREGWTLEVVQSFDEAEASERARWHAATPEERFEAAAQIRYIVYGKAAATARLQRVLEVVSGA
ncbi:hypothetical protein OKA04_07640 [Luteolibacter flavescens]|uniref:Uncharacterized protein n=1 Tax=Luteolibacter flavescens TaxID=1859460 RepID=A0ABT3FMW0_9BACT|nr:hypothetical protein [Luteolibacter flavescens]MCW1884601.1 hypothetical protein [Luteolibacter flavescens]